jgi:hypothetical protein
MSGYSIHVKQVEDIYQQNVVKFEVAVGDPLLVAVCNTNHQVPYNLLGEILRQFLVFNQAIDQGLSSKMLHYNSRDICIFVYTLELNYLVATSNFSQDIDFVVDGLDITRMQGSANDSLRCELRIGLLLSGDVDSSIYTITNL